MKKKKRDGQQSESWSCSHKDDREERMTGRSERRLRPDHAWFPKTLFFSFFFYLFFSPLPRVIIETRAGWSGGQGSNTNDHESRESKHTDNNAGSCSREPNKTQYASFENCVRFGGEQQQQQQHQQLYALQCTDRTHTHTVVYLILPFYFGLFLPPRGKNDSFGDFFVVLFFVLLFFSIWLFYYFYLCNLCLRPSVQQSRSQLGIVIINNSIIHHHLCFLFSLSFNSLVRSWKKAWVGWNHKSIQWLPNRSQFHLVARNVFGGDQDLKRASSNLRFLSNE